MLVGAGLVYLYLTTVSHLELEFPVGVAEEGLGGVEPFGGLEVGAAVVFADGPFAVVDISMMPSTQCDGIGFIRQAVVGPFFAVVALAVGGLDGAARGLAAFVAGEDCPALGCGEEPFGAVFVEYDVVAVPDLADEIDIT